ncbi:tetratricopeptide repeat protein [Streptomyces sp. NPDC003691]
MVISENSGTERPVPAGQPNRAGQPEPGEPGRAPEDPAPTVSGPARDRELAEAAALRDSGDPAAREEARRRLVALAAGLPGDAEVAYHAAWAHDVLEREAEAVPYYERALAATDPALPPDDRCEAYLGLGSTYRVLGRYEDAERTLRAGVAAFPGHGGLRAFLGMALYNTGRHEESVRLLLELLVRTSDDPTVRTFGRAISSYAEDLNRTV